MTLHLSPLARFWREIVLLALRAEPHAVQRALAARRDSGC